MPYVIQYKAAKPQDRVAIHVQPYTGEVLADYRWKDYGWIGKLTAAAICLHEGTWFGAWNQALNAVTALMIILLALTGIVMWWKRRPTLGVSFVLIFLVSKALSQ